MGVAFSHGFGFVHGSRGKPLDDSVRRNLLLWSEAFEDAVWGKNDCTITADALAAPSGAMTADALASTGNASIAQAVLTLPGITCTGSVWLRLLSGVQNILLIAYDDVGTATTLEVALTAAWQRFSLPITPGVGSTYCVFQIGGGFSIPNGVTVNLWGAQFEAGAFMTGYQRINGAFP